MQIEKKYFTIEEILERWQMPEHDLGYLAENDELRLSIRIYDVPMEFGEFRRLKSGGRRWSPKERTIYSGLVDLHPSDAYMIFRCSERNVFDFRQPDGSCMRVHYMASPVLVMLGDLLIRREERDRIEKVRGFKAAELCSGDTGFSASPDYHHVCCNGQHYYLGDVQARVVKELHSAAARGKPWQNGKHLLTVARSRSMRMADVFKSQSNWRDLIESDGRGLYRLRTEVIPEV